MKLVIQRVLSASVKVDGKTIGSIGKGYLVLIGCSFMLVEYFQHITFGTPMFMWSLYCVCGLGAIGLFLFVASFIPPLRAYLRRTFFF